MPIAKGFLYFVALKIGAEAMFNESLSLVAAAVCAILMVGVEVFIGAVVIAPAMGVHLARVRLAGAGMAEAIRLTFPGFLICLALNLIITPLIVFAFSKELWRSEFIEWRSFDWENIAAWSLLVAGLYAANHLLLIWSSTARAKTEM